MNVRITKDDVEYLNNSVSSFFDDLTNVINSSSESIASSILDDFKETWAEYYLWDEKTTEVFLSNVQARWGEAFFLLKLLIEISRDIGEETSEKLRRSRAKKRIPYARLALVKLHARACQVSSEILILLENGYANGAVARWRTLYEIGVVMTLISDGGDVVGKRYLDHEAVAQKQALDEALRLDEGDSVKISKKLRRDTERYYNSVLELYGRSFGGAYGWAAEYLGSTRPTFKDLEQAAGRVDMRSTYKMASYSVHAGVRGITSSHSHIDYFTDEIIAGASNAGMAEPGENTAFNLTLATGLLFRTKMKMDEIVKLRVLVMLRDEIVHEFRRAQRQLKKDHARSQRQSD